MMAGTRAPIVYANLGRTCEMGLHKILFCSRTEAANIYFLQYPPESEHSWAVTACNVCRTYYPCRLPYHGHPLSLGLWNQGDYIGLDTYSSPSGLWHCVVMWWDTTVSEVHAASIRNVGILTTTLHGVTTQNSIWTFIGVETSSLGPDTKLGCWWGEGERRNTYGIWAGKSL